MIEVRDGKVYQDGIKISESLEDASWNQGYLEMSGLYQKTEDTWVCQKCGHSYQVRRNLRFFPGGGLLADYTEAPDPGCPKGCK